MFAVIIDTNNVENIPDVEHWAVFFLVSLKDKH